MDVSYFKSVRDMYGFALLKMNGRDRADFLKMRAHLYNNTEAATKWRNNIAEILQDDTVPTDFSEKEIQKAIEKLDSFYRIMIDD